MKINKKKMWDFILLLIVLFLLFLEIWLIYHWSIFMGQPHPVK